MPATKPNRRPRLARRDRVAHEAYDYALAKADAERSGKPLVSDDRPAPVGPQSNHLRF